MRVVKTIDEVRKQVKEWRAQGLTVGLVPTMGYLHEGHASLIAASHRDNDRTVVSDFVNPMQFGPTEDLESYPRDIERDAKLVEEHGGDLIFNPEPSEMYHEGFSSFVDMTVLTQELCGLSRPVHFRGVCTVVSKLFNIVKPDRAYFGKKDAQQLAVIRHMVDDLNMDIEIVGCPIVRESDGLAKSSRNTYLNEAERKAALILSKSIRLGQDMVKKGEKLCGTRVIPLVIKKERMEKAKELAGDTPLMRLVPVRPRNYGVVTTGREVFRGRIQDTFTPVIEQKLKEFGCTMTEHVILDDNHEAITAAVLDMLNKGCEMVFCSGGMSVDPDDKTPLAIRNTGANIVSYGAPVLPGAMFLVSYMPDGRPVCGLPGCVMYARRTIFDLLLPYLVTDTPITKEQLAALGHGGLCLNCPVCHFPNCGFGKGT